MTKEWASYAQLQSQQSSSFQSDEIQVGLSDEEELRRYGQALSENGLGDLSSEFEDKAFAEVENL